MHSLVAPSQRWGFLLFFVLCDGNLNIFGFWSVGQTKETMWWHQLEDQSFKLLSADWWLNTTLWWIRSIPKWTWKYMWFCAYYTGYLHAQMCSHVCRRLQSEHTVSTAIGFGPHRDSPMSLMDMGRKTTFTSHRPSHKCRTSRHHLHITSLYDHDWAARFCCSTSPNKCRE